MVNLNNEFYFAIREGIKFTVYDSDQYKLSELDMLNLIKIMLINRRSINIGTKALLVYEDHLQDEAKTKLEKIGVYKENGKCKTRNCKTI